MEHLPRAPRPYFIVWVRSRWSGRDQHSLTLLAHGAGHDSLVPSLGTRLWPQIAGKSRE